MKKLLLTLGTAASVVAPIATVVACGGGNVSGEQTLTGSATVSSGTLTLDGFLGPRISGEEEEDKEITWMNEMGLELMGVDQSSVEKVVISGDIDLDWESELSRFDKIIDFAKTDYANLEEAYNHFDGLTTDEDTLSASGKLFNALVRTFDDNTPGGAGDIANAPDSVKTAHTAIESLTLESTIKDLDSGDIEAGIYTIDATNGTIDELGLVDAEVAKITGILATDFDLEEISFDSVSPISLDITFTEKSDPTDTMWKASISTINWTANTAIEIEADGIIKQLEASSVSADTIDAPTASLGLITNATEAQDKLGISQTEFDTIKDTITNSKTFEFISIEHDFAFNDSLTINFEVVAHPEPFAATMAIYWKNN